MKKQKSFNVENNKLELLQKEVIKDEEAGKYVIRAGLGLSAIHPEKEMSRKFVFGSLVRALREREGLSVKDLANKAEIKLDDVKFVELESSSDDPASDKVVYNLADYFKIDQRDCIRLMTGINKDEECPKLNESIDEFLSGIMWMSKKEKAIKDFYKHLNRCEDGCPQKQQK